jgi:hypothetical protein
MKDILLYLSAFIPMYILIFMKQLIEILIGNIKANVLNFIVLALLVLVVLLGLIGLKIEIYDNNEKCKNIVIIEKKNTTDRHFLGYFSLFVLFAITFDLSKISMLVVFLGIISMIGVVYVKNNLFYINPFLNILGYNFYDITYKLKNKQEKIKAKIFFKGELVVNKQYCVITKNDNFCFVVKK